MRGRGRTCVRTRPDERWSCFVAEPQISFGGLKKHQRILISEEFSDHV